MGAFFLSEAEGRPRYLHEIYSALAKKLKRINNELFKAQIRGILNASIANNEKIFKRISYGIDDSGKKQVVKGLYSINMENKTDFEKYLDSVEEREKFNVSQEPISQKEALSIYTKYIKFAYQQANQMHGTSCIVPLDELQSAGQIGLFKGAKEFRSEKSQKSGCSPIPFLKKYINGSLLNVIRKQKLWNSRNVIIEDSDVMDNINTTENMQGESSDFTDEISISELRDVLMSEMSKHLNPNEMDVISMRWGLDGDGGDTFKQIGKKICERNNKRHNDDSAKSWSWQVEQVARKKLYENSMLLREIYNYHYA